MITAAFDPSKYKTVTVSFLNDKYIYLPLFDIWYNWYQYSTMKSPDYEKNPSVLLIVYIPKNNYTYVSSKNDTLKLTLTSGKNTINCVNCIIVDKHQFVKLNPTIDQVSPNLMQKWDEPKKLWIFRINLIDYLLNYLPYDILLSDINIDALWLHNPMEYISNLQKQNNNFSLDIIGSR